MLAIEMWIATPVESVCWWLVRLTNQWLVLLVPLLSFQWPIQLIIQPWDEVFPSLTQHAVRSFSLYLSYKNEQQLTNKKYRTFGCCSHFIQVSTYLASILS